MARWQQDARRSARLLFSAELAAGQVSEEDLQNPTVARAVRPWPAAPAPTRLAQRLAMRQGWLTYERHCVAPYMAARRALLGDAAAGEPRLLVRVDEYPHAKALDQPQRYGTEAFARFQTIMKEHAVPYLVAVNTWLSRDYLNPQETAGRPLGPEERDMLGSLRASGASFGLHHRDHRSRDPRPRRRTALGLAPGLLAELVDDASATMGSMGITPRVFVPPFNRFDPNEYEFLASRFDVICGGPESVATVGFAQTPSWRGNAVYLPSYAPLYDRAGPVTGAVNRLIAERIALWVPVTLHWGWEADDGWEDLKRLAARLAGRARPWEEFLAAVAASR